MAGSRVDVSTDEMLRRICGEYLEMPGLSLTLAQAQRLWGLEAETCAELLQSLTERAFLCRRDDGTYARANGGLEPTQVRSMAKAIPTAGRQVRARL